MWEEISLLHPLLNLFPALFSLLVEFKISFFFFFFHLESIAKIIWGHAILLYKDGKACLY